MQLVIAILRSYRYKVRSTIKNQPAEKNATTKNSFVCCSTRQISPALYTQMSAIHRGFNGVRKRRRKFGGDGPQWCR